MKAFTFAVVILAAVVVTAEPQLRYRVSPQADIGTKIQALEERVALLEKLAGVSKPKPGPQFGSDESYEERNARIDREYLQRIGDGPFNENRRSRPIKSEP